MTKAAPPSYESVVGSPVSPFQLQPLSSPTGSSSRTSSAPSSPLHEAYKARYAVPQDYGSFGTYTSPIEGDSMYKDADANGDLVLASSLPASAASAPASPPHPHPPAPRARAAAPCTPFRHCFCPMGCLIAAVAAIAAKIEEKNARKDKEKEKKGRKTGCRRGCGRKRLEAGEDGWMTTRY